MQQDYRVGQRLELFPVTTRVQPYGDDERLAVEGCSLAELAQQYGTPLYLYDQATLDDAVSVYRGALARHYPGVANITYAGKAFLSAAMAQWAASRSLWIDCTGVGELTIARAGGVDAGQLLSHGVNKSAADLRAALAYAGTIVIDNLGELEKVAELRQRQACAEVPDLWLRLRPGMAVDTHAHTQTGQEDSKFGMDPIEAKEAVRLCQQHHLPLTGLHFHQGSHFRDPAPVGLALEVVLDLAVSLRTELQWSPQVLCPGGGWAVAYHEDELPHPAIDDYVGLVARRLAAGCETRGLHLPELRLEPGRSIVARGGVAVYRVGTVKYTGHRRWLLLDGGLADNPRPALYGARYSALPVLNPARNAIGPAWLAGPYCESGDVLIEDLPLPDMRPGELIAIPVSGAYQLSMASNYDGACKPAVVWLRDGLPHLIQERESLDDLVRRDRPLP